VAKKRLDVAKVMAAGEDAPHHLKRQKQNLNPNMTEYL